jgi:fumarate hydratase subunit beta
MSIKIKTPLTSEIVRNLHAGERVEISGAIYTARDAAHHRMIDMLKEGGDLLFPLEGQVIYYTGPSPARPGRPIGSCGPTTSSRMDPWTVPLLAMGLRGMIGKGERNQDVINAIKKYGAVYFAATGGAGAWLSQFICKARVIAYSDLGPEAVYQLEVKDFPAICAIDCHGNSLYDKWKVK